MPPKAAAQVWPGANPAVKKLTAKQKAKAAASEKAAPATPIKSKAKPKPAPEPESESEGEEEGEEEEEEEDEEEEEPETPVKKVKAAVKTPVKTPAKTPPKTPAKTPRARQPVTTHTTVDFSLLKTSNNTGARAPIIDVGLGNSEAQAEAKKRGGFEKLLRLESGNKFEVLRTYMLPDGPDEGCQVILIRPAKPFNLMGLSKETRSIIFEYYFANKGIVGEPINLDGKRKGPLNDVYAKAYSNDSKNRVGLLAVCKEIYAEAVPVFYHIPIRFEGTASVMDFMTQIDTSVRQHIVSIEIKNYQRTSARNALSLLSECKNLNRLHFENGVYVEGDPQRGARQLFADGHKFLQAINTARGNKEAGVNILSFGRNAFTLKDEGKGKDGKSSKAWPEFMVKEMREALQAKMSK